MKICLVAPVSGWRGGIHQYSISLANSLAEKVAVEVIAYKSIFPLWLYPGDATKRSGDCSGEVPLCNAITVYRILKYYSLLSALKAARLVHNRIRPEAVDIQWMVPYHGFVLLPLMLLLRYGGGIRVFLTVHNVLPHEPRLFDRLLSRWAFQLAHRLLVHAEAMKEALIATFGEESAKIAVIPHGICADAAIVHSRSHARAQLGINEAQVVLFFGYVRPYKGLEYLITAFKELIRKFDVALVIAGEFFSGFPEYQRLIQQNGLAEKTYLFPEYIPYQEIPLFFSAADIVVQPYSYFSSQSGVTQTAYAHALPVVATDVGGLPELVRHGETGLIVKPGDAQALSMALDALLTDPPMQKEYGANGRRLLETHLGWEKVAARLLALYGET